MEALVSQVAGWRVVAVPYFDWDSLQSSDEKREYLQKILSDAVS